MSILSCRSAPRACGVSSGDVMPDSWRDQASCLDEDPELFFPIGSTGPALEQIEEAKAVCRRCPVAAQCLSWALDTGEAFGVWGGLSEDERRAELRRRARARQKAVRAGAGAAA